MIDARLEILYLVAVGVAAFTFDRAEILAGLLGLQLVSWLVARLGVVRLLRTLRSLWFFLFLLVLSYALFDRADEPLLLQGVDVSGLALGLVHASRVVTVVLAAQLIRLTGAPGSFAEGLRGLKLPPTLAHGLDLVLAALGPDARSARPPAGERFGVRQVLRGDLSPLLVAIERRVSQAREAATDEQRGSDLPLIAGLGVVAMTIRMVKIAPGLPIAPGHKGVLVIPLYLAASALGLRRWAGVKLGALVGAASFALGFGKYGPFDVLKHLAPGLVADLLLPVVRGFRPSWLGFGLVGALAALSRMTVQVSIALLVGAPPAFYVLLAPMVVSNLIFGFLSGFVTDRLFARIDRPRLGLAASVDTQRSTTPDGAAELRGSEAAI